MSVGIGKVLLSFGSCLCVCTPIDILGLDSEILDRQHESHGNTTSFDLYYHRHSLVRSISVTCKALRFSEVSFDS